MSTSVSHAGLECSFSADMNFSPIQRFWLQFRWVSPRRYCVYVKRSLACLTSGLVLDER